MGMSLLNKTITMREKILCILIGFFISSALSVSAGGALGSATLPLQITQNTQLLKGNSSTKTAANSLKSIEMIDIQNKIANEINPVVLSSMTNNTSAWIKSGLNGNPLVVDPGRYITDQGLLAVREVADAVPNDSTGDAIFNSILRNYRDVSLKEKIKSQTTSNIPLYVQKNMCSDSKLTSLAAERALRADGSVDPVKAKSEKQYLYSYACTCNPSSNAECAAKLTDLYRQRPSLGGANTLLLLTSGDNVDNRILQVNTMLALAKQRGEDRAERELYDGLGPISDTKCIREESDLNGNIYCAESTVITPGEVVQSVAETSFNAPLLRAISLDGVGLTEFLKGMLPKSINAGLVDGFAGISGGSAFSSYTPRSKSPAVQDLFGQPEAKQAVTTSINKYILLHEDTITSLDDVNNKYDALGKSYGEEVRQIKLCFDDLIRSNTISSNDQRAVNAFTYYDNRMSLINPIIERTAKDAAKVRDAKELFSTTKAKLNTTNSSEEIGAIFNTYSSTYESRGYPSPEYVTSVTDSYSTDSEKARDDTEKNTHISNCNQAKQEVQSSVIYDAGINVDSR